MGFGFMTEEHVATVRKTLNDEILPRHLACFEKLAADSASGWIAGGNDPTIADFILVPRLQWLVEPGTNVGIDEHILEKYPNLKNMMNQFLNLPVVKDFYKSHSTSHQGVGV